MHPHSYNIEDKKDKQKQYHQSGVRMKIVSRLIDLLVLSANSITRTIAMMASLSEMVLWP